MKLEFSIMRVEGFGPIQKEIFDWGLHGLNIIGGANGNGKTKFTNALVWVLFGQTLKGSVETWESVKPKDYRGTKVSQRFRVNGYEYKVTRCKDYKGKVNGSIGKNRLIIEEEGAELDFDDKRESQKELEKILGYSLNLFKNSIIFGQKLKRLVEETGPNKKALLDEAFEVGYIAKANKLAGEYKMALSQRISQLETDINISENLIESTGKRVEDRKLAIANFEKDRDESIEMENLKRAKLQSELRPLKEKLESYELVELELSTKLVRKSELVDEISKLNTSQSEEKVAQAQMRHSMGIIKTMEGKIGAIQKVIESIPKFCSRCNKPYTQDEINKELYRLGIDKGDLDKEITKEKLNINKFEEVIAASQIGITSLNKLTIKKDNITKEINALEGALNITRKAEIATLVRIKNQIKDCRDAILSLKAKTPPKNYDDLLRVLKEENLKLTELTKERDTVLLEFNDYTWMIKEPLSNSGLKAFIFNRMLDSINDRLEYYSKFSGTTVGFIIDMESTKKDLDTVIAIPTGEFVPYEDLSGGQQQKVDIVIGFALHDVIGDNKDCTLLILDELFESLDADNIELLTELIQDKAKNKCLYLVTHRTEFAPTNANIINTVFESGVTRIID